MPAGRPLKFETVEALQKKIDAYFADCAPHPVRTVRYEFPKIKNTKKVAGVTKTVSKDDRTKKPKEIIEWGISAEKIPTITGLALALDTSRETLRDYEKGVHDDGELIEGHQPEYSDTIKKAKLRIQQFNEENLYSNHPTGTIFNLKNNYGWKDKSETEHSGEVNVKGATIEFGDPNQTKDNGPVVS